MQGDILKVVVSYSVQETTPNVAVCYSVQKDETQGGMVKIEREQERDKETIA